MNFACCHFTYAGTSSRTYGLVFAHCDTSESVMINGGIESASIFNSRNNRKYLVGDSYVDSPITIEVEIFTEDCVALSTQEIKTIESWLFNRKNFYKLYINPDDDVNGETYEVVNGVMSQYYLNCRFINPEKILGNGGVAGFKATMECDSHLMWQDAISQTFNIGNTAASDSDVISLVVNSDMNEYVYPTVSITMAAAGGDIYITNNTDSATRITSFKSLTGEIVFTINSEINYISGNNYMKFYDKNFPRLLPGTNAIGIVGAISSITFTWENRKYL